MWCHLSQIIYGSGHLLSTVPPSLPPCLQNAVIAALSSKSWDVETATELLLSNWTPSGCPGSHPPFIRLYLHLPSTLPPLSEPSFSLTIATDLTAVANCLATLLPVWVHLPSIVSLSFHQGNLSRVSQSFVFRSPTKTEIYKKQN